MCSCIHGTSDLRTVVIAELSTRHSGMLGSTQRGQHHRNTRTPRLTLMEMNSLADCWPAKQLQALQVPAAVPVKDVLNGRRCRSRVRAQEQ